MVEHLRPTDQWEASGPSCVASSNHVTWCSTIWCCATVEETFDVSEEHFFQFLDSGLEEPVVLLACERVRASLSSSQDGTPSALYLTGWSTLITPKSQLIVCPRFSGVDARAQPRESLRKFEWN